MNLRLNMCDAYSYVSNKRAVGNKRAGWIFSGILIIVQGGYDPSDEY